MQLSSSTLFAIVLLCASYEAYSLPLEPRLLQERSPMRKAATTAAKTVAGGGKGQVPKPPPLTVSSPVLKKGSNSAPSSPQGRKGGSEPKKGPSSAPSSPNNQKPWRAGDLKTPDYAKIGWAASKQGAYSPTADGKSVEWNDKLQSGRGKLSAQIDHRIQPDQVIPAFKQLGIDKDHPVVPAVKEAMNSEDNLVPLRADLNKLKHHMTVGNNINEENQGNVGAVHDFMKKTQSGADKTIQALDLAGHKHGVPELGNLVKEKVNSFPSGPGTDRTVEALDLAGKKPGHPRKTKGQGKEKRQSLDLEDDLASRSIDDEFDLVSRSFDDFELDELE